MIRKLFIARYSWVVGVAACFILFYWPVIFGNQVFYCCDNLLINIPAKVIFTRALLSGHVPVWNPFILSGMPFLADINLSLLFPTSILFLFLSPFRALSIGIAICIFVSMIGMFGLVHTLTRSRSAGAVAALLWGLSGTMVTYLNNLPMVQVISIMPWVLWSLTRYVDKQTNTRFVMLVCSLALSIFGGHPHMIYLTGLLVVSWIFLYGDLSWSARWKILGHVGLYVVALTAVEIFPFVELMLHSTRFGRGFSYASSGSMHPASIIRLLFPAITGSDAAGTSWILGGSVNGYIGIVGIWLSMRAKKEWRYVHYFRWLAGLSFVMALGRFTPLFGWMYRIMPGVSWFRSPENYIVLTTFALCVLASVGINHIDTHLSRWHKTILLTACSFLGAIVLVALEVPSPYGASTYIFPYLPDTVVKKIIGLGSAGGAVLWRSTWQNVLFEVCAVACIIWFISDKRKMRFRIPVIVGIIVAELYLFVAPVMITVPHTSVLGWFARATDTVKETHVRVGDGRMLTDQSSFPNPHPHTFGHGFWPEESAWQVNILRPNLHVLFGLSSPDGYSSTVLRSYQNFVSPYATDPTGVDFRQASHGLLEMLGVRDVIKTKSAKFSQVEHIRVLGEDELVCDGCAITGLTQTWNETNITVQAIHAVMALSHIPYYPGWQTYIDGTPQDLHIYNGFLSTQIPAGRHRITFRFISLSVQLGAALSLLAACALLFRLRTLKLMNKQKIEDR